MNECNCSQKCPFYSSRWSFSPFSRFSCVLYAIPFDERRAMQTTNMQIRSGSFHSFAFFIVVVVFFSLRSLIVVVVVHTRANAGDHTLSLSLQKSEFTTRRRARRGKKRNDQSNSSLSHTRFSTVPCARRLLIDV